MQFSILSTVTTANDLVKLTINLNTIPFHAVIIVRVLWDAWSISKMCDYY